MGVGQLLSRGVLAGWDACVAVPRHVGVEVDDVGDPLGDPVGRTGDDRPAVASADQNHTGQVLVVQHVDDIGDVGVEIDLRMREVDALAVPSQGGGAYVVPGRLQAWRYPSTRRGPRRTSPPLASLTTTRRPSGTIRPPSGATQLSLPHGAGASGSG